MHGVRAYASQSPHPLLPSAKTTTTGLPKKPPLRRNSSFELDVFDAKRYFSGAMDNILLDVSMKATNTTEQKVTCSSTKKEIANTPVVKDIKRESRWKKQQPGSPAGTKLAGFLSSLFFHQAASARKQKSLNNATNIDDDCKDTRSLTGWRRRGGSSSRSKSLGSCDSQSLCSHRSSGFSTPGFSDSSTPTVHKEKSRYCISKQNKEPKAETSLQQNKVNSFNGRCDQRLYRIEFEGTDGYVSNKRMQSKTSDRYLEKEWILINEFMDRDKNSTNCRREVDGGEWESDSSSDLFELDNYDLGAPSSCLPVFGSANMERFKEGTTIVGFAS